MEVLAPLGSWSPAAKALGALQGSPVRHDWVIDVLIALVAVQVESLAEAVVKPCPWKISSR